MRFLFIVIILALFLSCSQNTDSSHILDVYRYSNNVIPWEMDVAQDWTMVKNIYKEEGLDSIKGQVENSDTVDSFVVGFQKDEYNMLQFTVEPFVEDFEGEWLKNTTALKKLLFDFYVQEGVKIDTTSSIEENIGGLDFSIFSAKLYNSKDSLILNQEFYSTLYNDYDLSVCLTFNNFKNEHQLKRMWRNSTFK